MTLEREGHRGPWVVQCDDCNEVMELDCFDFYGARGKLKSRGWATRFNSEVEEWEHFCGDCK